MIPLSKGIFSRLTSRDIPRHSGKPDDIPGFIVYRSIPLVGPRHAAIFARPAHLEWPCPYVRVMQCSFTHPALFWWQQAQEKTRIGVDLLGRISRESGQRRANIVDG